MQYARRRCAMCGRTGEKHGVRLVADHRIPRDWGGTNENDNLWVICEDCRAGKAENFQDHQSALKWIGDSFAHDIIHAGDPVDLSAR